MQQVSAVHPWFTSPLKRKFYESESDPFQIHTPRAKADSRAKRRRRIYDSIEGGMAGMTLLSPAASPTVNQQIEREPVRPPWYNIGARYKLTPSREPGSLEPIPSPPGLQVPEIKMKGSSWYEPEKDRIVVTDLDSDSENENELPSHGLGPAPVNFASSLPDLTREEYTIPALVSRVSIPRPIVPLPNRQREDTSRALVLFRPIGLPESAAPKAEGKDKQSTPTLPSPIIEEVVDVDPSNIADDDAMEIDEEL